MVLSTLCCCNEALDDILTTKYRIFMQKWEKVAIKWLNTFQIYGNFLINNQKNKS